MSSRCGMTKKDGTACKAWAVRGSDPPRCVAHGGGKGKVGAPVGNANARTHGVYATQRTVSPDLDARIADLDARIVSLAIFIDERTADLSTEEFIKLLALHGQLISRLGRLMSQQDKGGGDAELQQAIDEALDRLSKEWGIEL